jgi:hypothetical protein
MRMLSLGDRPGYLEGRSVFLSASVPSRPGFPVDAHTEFVIEQAVVALVRTVLAESGRLVYGGHPTMSKLIAAVAPEYVSPTLGETNRSITIYQSRYFSSVIPQETKDLERLGYARIVLTDADRADRPFNPSVREEQGLTSLEAMRTTMVKDAEPIVMLAIGGMEGIYREAMLFSQHVGAGRIFALETTSAAARHLARGTARLEGHTVPETRSLEREWMNATGAKIELVDGEPTSDPSRPFVPYLLMFQWLFEVLGGGSHSR